MENKMEDLSSKKRDCSGLNVALKAKLETLRKLEKEMYQKYMSLEDKSTQKLSMIDNDLMVRNRERLELEASNRLMELDLKNEMLNNEQLEYILNNTKKIEELHQLEFEKQLGLIEQATKDKIKEYEAINEKTVRTYLKFYLETTGN